jgi:chemotaxis protein MotB
MTKYGLRGSALAFPFLAAALLSACVSQSKYDELDAQNRQLQQQNAAQQQQLAAKDAAIAAEKQHVARLQGAIKYTVNSDLLFKSGSWDMSSQGQQIIAKMASQLAPFQEQKLVVNGYTDNAPVGKALQRKGVASNEALSQKRADTVMKYLITKGVKPELVSSRGFGEAQPIAPNTDARGRAQNRRVEVTLAGS